MTQRFTYKHSIGRVDVSVEQLGSHLAVCISGGDAPHIGSVVVATPRPSLTGCGMSATSSVINLPGHKDEFIAREVAESLASTLDTITCCICGVHKNDATPEDIAACVTLGADITSSILELLSSQGDTSSSELPESDPRKA